MYMNVHSDSVYASAEHEHETIIIIKRNIFQQLNRNINKMNWNVNSCMLQFSHLKHINLF